MSGVPIATVSDNIQDPFVPTGSGDMLEMARWTLLAGHLKGDELATAYAMITDVPAKLMRLGDYTIRKGVPANLNIMRPRTSIRWSPVAHPVPASLPVVGLLPRPSIVIN
ncbi:amidohydrolase family protein [Paracoccus sp. (in: a-proteobacteria)]|uniref:amidohydrolase family protein n=1 Tax=Paracoccus TaxID=265 RepID=UPI00334030CA